MLNRDYRGCAVFIWFSQVWPACLAKTDDFSHI